MIFNFKKGFSSPKEWGEIGEEKAARFLQGKRYHIVKRNYFTRLGELDIIARRGDFLVFVEVKTQGKRIKNI